MGRFDAHSSIKLLEREVLEDEALVEQLVLIYCEVLFQHLMFVGHFVGSHLLGWMEVQPLWDTLELLIPGFGIEF